MTDDDKHLIARCRANDTSAFGVLVKRHQGRLLRSLVALLGSPHDAADVAQDTFVAAYVNLDSFRGESAFYSWLFRIAYNAAMSARRRRSRQHLTSLNGDSPDQPTTEVIDSSLESNPAYPAERAEDRQALHRALDRLPEEERTTIALRELEGLTYDEIADIMNCPVGTVRSRLSRARESLREHLIRQSSPCAGR